MQFENYDLPCFKILAKNDTAAAAGHQGGLVIPKAIEEFFPDLTDPITSVQPTRDVELIAEIWIDGLFREIVRPRYQHQTWGGTRSPERRLTSNLTLLRREAQAGDIVTFERNLEIENYFRISLVKRGTELFQTYSEEILDRKSGSLRQKPASNSEIRIAAEQVEFATRSPFVLFADAIETIENRGRKIARESAFRKLVLNAYGFSCAFSNRKVFDPDGAHGLDAAHIVPLSRQGTNDVRNGIVLSKELHWAFDRGLIGLNEGKIRVSPKAKSVEQNNYLSQFESKDYRLPHIIAHQPHDDALNWHFSNIFKQ